LPDCIIISIFEIDDNYYRVFSVCSQLKDQFIIAVDSEGIVLCTALRLLLYGLVTGVGANKESVHTFSRRQIVCTMIFILCAIIMLQAGILYRLWQQRRQAELLARNRLRYIEEWLDLLYLYNNDPVSFHTRCKELASVKRLSNYHIVNDSLRLSDCRGHRRSNLTPAEKEFLCLMEAGFSNRALCVIFRVGKVGSIYVKHHRIKAKIVNVNKSVGGD